MVCLGSGGEQAVNIKLYVVMHLNMHELEQKSILSRPV